MENCEGCAKDESLLLPSLQIFFLDSDISRVSHTTGLTLTLRSASLSLLYKESTTQELYDEIENLNTERCGQTKINKKHMEN